MELSIRNIDRMLIKREPQKKVEWNWSRGKPHHEWYMEDE